MPSEILSGKEGVRRRIVTVDALLAYVYRQTIKSSQSLHYHEHVYGTANNKPLASVASSPLCSPRYLTERHDPNGDRD